jgi:hypothetical protein
MTSNQMPETHTAIIDCIGVSNLCSGLGVPESHIRVMKVRNSIPVAYWPRVVEIAASTQVHGISLELLTATQKKRGVRAQVQAAG